MNIQPMPTKNDGPDPKVKNETVRDTLMDLAAYALLAVVELENETQP